MNIKRIFYAMAFILAIGTTACDQPQADEENIDGEDIEAPGYSDPNPNMSDMEMDTVGTDTTRQ